MAAQSPPNPPERERNIRANLATCSEKLARTGLREASLAPHPAPGPPPAKKNKGNTPPFPTASGAAGGPIHYLSYSFRYTAARYYSIPAGKLFFPLPNDLSDTPLPPPEEVAPWVSGLDHIPNALLETYLTAGWITFQGKLWFFIRMRPTCVIQRGAAAEWKLATLEESISRPN